MPAMNIYPVLQRVVGCLWMKIPHELDGPEEELVEVAGPFKEKGIGAELVKYAIDYGKEMSDVLAITLRTNPTGFMAQKYKKMGFIQLTGELCLLWLEPAT
ncbi:hypothetical protein FOL47_005771 [Perkinsus chesapeaki]|uniref:N-acetyltransferase domain-containing protein n=1 Tax=Perkinsus chesapeaki TaxID=330153 RepID=A0A7J6LVP3_PERCH|nr:hypothetical protein FOL47_005771 [Perkinsus chesapeaki]